MAKLKRHKWEKQINHPNCHKYNCKNCPCIKDATNMTNTIYWLNDEKLFYAPNCETIKITSMEDSEKPLAYNSDEMKF